VADNGDCHYSGIDRKDSSKGYILSNVVSCCFTCNKAKGTMSEKEFLEWIDRIIAFRERKGLPSIPAVV
jgi:5-methylcytosine-specific restriction endonuclease McrA